MDVFVFGVLGKTVSWKRWFRHQLLHSSVNLKYWEICHIIIKVTVHSHFLPLSQKKSSQLTSRLTVGRSVGRSVSQSGSQSVSLGVEPHLGLMTRYLAITI
jgi:hypothetical protein